jgi:hypothetical protein
MRHRRHYTLEQANAVRGWVAQRVEWVREAHATLVTLGAAVRDTVAALDGAAGGAYPGRELARPLVELSRALGELEAVDIVLRDLERGLVDFPALRDRATKDPRVQGRLDAEAATGAGREIYLCWLVDDEDTIGFWHEPEAGFAGRRRL